MKTYFSENGLNLIRARMSVPNSPSMWADEPRYAGRSRDRMKNGNYLVHKGL